MGTFWSTTTTRGAPAVALADLSTEELAAFMQLQRAAYDELKLRGLKLDVTRGKPSAQQLDLSNGLLDLPDGFVAADGTDTRNYGGLLGLTELREIFAELLGVNLDQLTAQGNSSLTLMQQVLVGCLLHGAVDSERPWSAEGTIKFICPVPGYDRHFALLNSFGIEMVPVPMHEDGPDADKIAALVKDDPSIKGMWVVPTYANPTGDTVTEEVAAKLLAMPTAAPDFKIFWDNAYALHHLTQVETKSVDVISLAASSGNPHRPIMFASTSKITFAGAGVAFLAASTENITWYLKHLGLSSIGPDKVNQLRHAQFFKDAGGVREHMRAHAQIIAPKFDAVERILTERLAEHDIARWTTPIGGYFVSLDVLPGTASRVVELAKEAGIALTPAGSSYPLGNDPDDENIRLAPTMPPLEEVEVAMDGVATCVLLAAGEYLTSH
ncbi:aminotransferase class I/II-fold pyridoxal phosphate-dependent enzyme [Yimella sp. cx-51]|uniref:aminotransferase class I/II-fold pyridoxal phosphate-dependent enzyme n=1 Tax=Yimella sp. cx-51 TaxID=2770551 RepID=UPI00165E6D29|nr:aminotransferase class I/II-fold pyridoxal phosphate-dependent enzyme [Yimella sp. cx-51]MBC9955894.1 aminotransferase class I/II-fold pyridoxal phosphate-dependent enzyme [Yimella sp. cx-51]QTH37563.1 aminotransferase class I/II-fold pyridoxal phosphate-dependent enzyme [Yimella sp. cx-51]